MGERERVERALHDDPGRCPICEAWLEIRDLASGRVRLVCSEGCTNAELRAWLGLPPAVDAERVWKCLMLARDLGTWAALLVGEPVPLSRLDPEWVERFGLRDEVT